MEPICKYARNVKRPRDVLYGGCFADLLKEFTAGRTAKSKTHFLKLLTKGVEAYRCAMQHEINKAVGARLEWELTGEGNLVADEPIPNYPEGMDWPDLYYFYHGRQDGLRLAGRILQSFMSENKVEILEEEVDGAGRRTRGLGFR